MLTNEREQTIQRFTNHQEVDKKSQAGASCKSISVTDHTTNSKVERSSEYSSVRSSSREGTFSDNQGGRRVVKHTRLLDLGIKLHQQTISF